VSEHARLTESTLVIRQAIGLLDLSLQGLSTPERWCQGSWAKDRAGMPIFGRIVEAVVSERVASRCNLAELLSHGLARGYRIEIAVEGLDQAATEVTRAPASWMLAAFVLAYAALVVATERQLLAKDKLENEELPPPSGVLRRGEFILFSMVINDRARSHDEAFLCPAFAAEILRAELDRRAQDERR
jgi:hypothetical protein